MAGNEAVPGFECKAYHNTGTNAVPVWDEMVNVVDASVDLTKTKVDTSRRVSKWKFSKGGQLEGDITLKFMHTIGSDSDFDALRASYIDGTAVQIAIMDQAIATSGAEGLWAFCEVFGIPYSQDLDDAETFDINLAPTDNEESGSLVEPTWKVVA